MHIFLYLIMAAAAPVVMTPGQSAKLERVVIDSAKGERVFMVEVVREEKERNRGLMFRHSLPDNGGMLFDYDPPQTVDFWMKNTYIPLDIMFIDATGHIITIAQNTTPLSLDHIPSGGPARGVLEINGGLSAKLGIKTGDTVHHALFERAP
jgi:uncharacterized membrane protein (UPF0127 family)